LKRVYELEEFVEAHLPVPVQVRHEDHLVHLVVRRLLSHALQDVRYLRRAYVTVLVQIKLPESLLYVLR
jgi:hypothetical protein